MTSKYPAPKVPMIPARHHGGSQNPKAIVIHATVSSDNPGTARKIAEWWNSSRSPVTSAHYTVDPAEVIQSVGDHTVAYHCGSNTDTIGIELCDEQTGPAKRWADADSVRIIKRAARLTAQLCLAYDIEPVRPTTAALKRKGKHGIYGHNDSRLAFGKTSHTDPRDFPWSYFLTQVRLEIAKIKKEASAPVKPTPAPVATTAIQKFHRGVRDGVLQVYLLDEAVLRGRTGDVKKAVDAIDRAFRGLQREIRGEKTTIPAKAVAAWDDDKDVDLAALARSAKRRPGAVRSAYQAILKAIETLPKV